MNLLSIFSAVWLIGLAMPGWGQGVVIHELVADNRNGLRDEDGAASDWLELHNPTAAPISLAGAALTDSAADLSKWPLPGLVLLPQGYLVIFASGKDRRDPAGPLHANFSLSKSGEFLALTWPGQVVAGFVPAFPPQLEDVSYGYRSSGSPDLVFMRQPTPGAPNDASGVVPGAVTVSPPGGTFTGSLMAVLHGPTPGAELHYTMDGSVPTAASPVYSGPFSVNATTRLRAVAVAGGLTGQISGAAWVRLAPDMAGYTSPLPLMVIDNFNAGTVPSKGFPTQDGSDTVQVAAQQAVWIVQEKAGDTASWSGSPQLAGEIGIRGRGALSTTWAQPAYAVECRAAGGPATGASPLGMPANEDWVLYYPDPSGALRDSTMLANTFIYELSRRLGRYAPRFRFVELFLNDNGGDLTMADRRGVYVLMEKISRGKQRLDFSPLSADGAAGGALLSINRMDAIPETGFPAANGAMSPQFFRTAGPDGLLQTTPDVSTPAGDDLPGYHRAFLNFEQPGGYRILTAQRAAVEGWFRQFEGALYHPSDWRDPVSGWRKWLVEEDWTAGYLLINFVRHSDALQLSLYPWLGDDRKLRLGPIWDVTPGSYTDQGGPESALYYRAGQLWFPRLFEDLDFKQAYVDRWTHWRRSGFSDAAMESIIDQQAAEITAGKAVAQGMGSAAEWQTRLNALKGWVKGRAAYFDHSFVPLPVIQPPGGMVAAGSLVTVSSGAPEWWVTTDGSDPRLPGGGVSPAARAAGGVVVAEDVRLVARSRNGAEWSGPVSVVFAVGAVAAAPGNLRISEVHYHPAAPDAAAVSAGFAGGGEFEFIELHNPGAQKISLHGVRLVLDRNLYQPAWEGAGADQWTLPAGGRLVLVRNRAAFAQRYGTAGPVGGTFQGELSNAAASVVFETLDGTPLAAVTYGSEDPWPAAADGAGYSLTLREAGAGAGAADWRSSVALHGTPGGTDAVPYLGTSEAAWQAYALGSRPVVSLAESAGSLRLSVVLPPGADRARYTVEESADLSRWETAAWIGALETRLQSGQYLWSWMAPAAAPVRFVRLRARALP